MQDFSSEQSQEQDRSIVAGIRSADPKLSAAAHRALVKKYGRRLFEVIRSLSIDGDTAQDLCQHTWLTAQAKVVAGEYEPRPGHAMIRWLVTIAKYHTLTWKRTWWRYDKALRSSHGALQLQPSQGESPEAREQIKQALASLTPEEQSAVQQMLTGICDVAEQRRIKDRFARVLQRLQTQLSTPKEQNDDEQHGQGRTHARIVDQR